MKEITTSQFSFENVITCGNVYVDKTDLLARLASIPYGQFFISRPRRFGKSLMLSTLKCIFEGRKDLFEGLKIMKTDYEWKTYPVLHFDMAGAVGSTPRAIADGLNTLTLSAARTLNIDIPRNDDASQTFLSLWEEITNRGMEVVVLVDEYDVPLQGCLNDRAMFETVRKMMHDFYVRLKTYSGNIRFLMLTGVTKLTKLSVFSGLNNPTDLTMDADYAGLLGYTHDELKTFFAEHIAAFANEAGITSEEVVRNLLDRYDNYRFAPQSDIKVLNPVSVGSSLANHDFENYWSATGAPSLVIEALRRANTWPADLERISATRSQLDVCAAPELPIVPLLYQSGYLTIRDVDGRVLKLGIPNAEVRETLVSGHLSSLVGDMNGPAFATSSIEAAQNLTMGNLDKSISIFRAAVANLPYEWLIQDEGAVKVAFLDFFQAMPHAHVTAERQIANGRIDAIIETSGHVYIFEFKYNRSAQEAFDQIVEKGYAKPYLGKGKPVTGIGLNFNPASGSRGIDDPVIGALG